MRKPFRSAKPSTNSDPTLDAEFAAALQEEKEFWAPDLPPHPSIYFFTDNYLTYDIDSTKDYVYLRRFLRQMDTPDPDDETYAQCCSQFASISEARVYLNRLLAIAQTFTAQPYARGYLDDNLIAGPVELQRMQHLMQVADIELSESDQALLLSGQPVKRGSFENEYLNQTVHILSARELVGSLDAYFSHLEDCATDYRSIERILARLKKTPFFRFIKRRWDEAALENNKYYAERNTKNIIHVINRHNELLHILYGPDFQQILPLYCAQLCNSDSASDLVWRYVDSIAGAIAPEAEWQKLPLSQFDDITLLQTIKLHYKVNHIILARRNYLDTSDHSGALNAKPENRLSPAEFAEHFPKLAHLQRFVCLHSCRYNPWVDGHRTSIIPILDEYYANRSITKFDLN